MLTSLVTSVVSSCLISHAEETSTTINKGSASFEFEYEPNWEEGVFGYRDVMVPDIQKHYMLGNCGAPKKRETKSLNDLLNRQCLSLKNESVIADALHAIKYDTYIVLTGKDVIVLDKQKYTQWQQTMANSLLKVVDGSVGLMLVPVKLASGVVLTVVGVFAAPFEPNDEMGYRFRSGVGLMLKSVGDVVADTAAILSGATLGIPSYLVANVGPHGKGVFTEVTEFPSP